MTKAYTAELREKIRDIEYRANRMHLFANGGVRVRNIRTSLYRNTVKADVILHLDDVQERYNGVEYRLTEVESWKVGK